jgi:hypothetical protein
VIKEITKGYSVMSISKIVAVVTQYISEAAMEIFAPTRDSYPNIGVQPFSGEPFKGHVDRL